MLRLKQILIFLGIFGLILALSHLYMVGRINYYLHLSQKEYFFVALIFGSCAFLTWLIIPLSQILPKSVKIIVAWGIYPWMGFALLMFVTIGATDIVWFFVKLIPEDYLPQPLFLFQYGFGVIALTLGISLGLISLWNGLRSVKIKPLTIHLKRLPESFNGFKIIQITDLHIGSLIKGPWLQEIVDKINALNPDLIVITGDLVDGSLEDLKHHVTPLRDLKASAGVYFVTGNHEYYSGVEAWCSYISHLGVRVLRNTHVSIMNSQGDSFDLAGVDDWGSRYLPEGGASLPKALEGRDSQKTLILLAHQPMAIYEAATRGGDLQLSGHTHNGQIWPFTYLVYLQQPYTKGLYRHKETQTQIYVSPGTGFWGPPMRLGSVAEITHITLQCEA